MGDEKMITAFYEQDHDRLDELFKTFQQTKRSDFDKAKAAFNEFKGGLQRHIVWEEDLLFTLWEAKTGISEGGPTMVMRSEHRQIGQLLESIHEKVAAGNPDTDQEEQWLISMLGSHNMKEERVLYPSIDNVASVAEREQVFRDMETIPEARYNACCSGH